MTWYIDREVNIKSKRGKPMESIKRITYLEAKYLKHVAAQSDVKVSLQILDKTPLLHIQDNEFTTFAQALMFLQYVVPQVVVS